MDLKSHNRIISLLALVGLVWLGVAGAFHFHKVEDAHKNSCALCQAHQSKALEVPVANGAQCHLVFFQKIAILKDFNLQKVFPKSHASRAPPALS